MKFDIKKKIIGQNVTVIIEDEIGSINKYTKTIKDKEVRTKLIDNITSIIDKISNSKSEKVIKKEVDILINIFTSKEQAIKKIEEVKEVKQKAIEKKVKKLDKNSNIEYKKELAKVKTYNIGVIDKVSRAISKKESEVLVVHNNNLVLKGFESIPMPKLLVSKIEEFASRGVSIQFLINFWYKCLANPNHVARTKLFDYLVGQNIIITSSGNFVTYRMVKDCNRSGDKLDGYFTDAHTYTMRYIPGTICAIPRSECDEDGSRDCSRGLHTGNPKFIGIHVEKSDIAGLGDGYKEITYSPSQYDGYDAGYGTGYSKPVERKQSFSTDFGNVPIICIVNPSNVVSIPDSDTRKMRSCEFYFVKTTTVEEVIALEAGDYLLFDRDYEDLDIQNLKKIIKEQGLTNYIEKDNYRDSDLTKLKSKLQGQLIKLKVNDNVSKDLSLDQVKQLVKNRIQ